MTLANDAYMCVVCPSCNQYLYIDRSQFAELTGAELTLDEQEVIAAASQVEQAATLPEHGVCTVPAPIMDRLRHALNRMTLARANR